MKLKRNKLCSDCVYDIVWPPARKEIADAIGCVVVLLMGIGVSAWLAGSQIARWEYDWYRSSFWVLCVLLVLMLAIFTKRLLVLLGRHSHLVYYVDSDGDQHLHQAYQAVPSDCHPVGPVIELWTDGRRARIHHAETNFRICRVRRSRGDQILVSLEESAGYSLSGELTELHRLLVGQPRLSYAKVLMSVRQYDGQVEKLMDAGAELSRVQELLLHFGEWTQRLVNELTASQSVGKSPVGTSVREALTRGVAKMTELITTRFEARPLRKWWLDRVVAEVRTLDIGLPQEPPTHEGSRRRRQGSRRSSGATAEAPADA